MSIRNVLPTKGLRVATPGKGSGSGGSSEDTTTVTVKLTTGIIGRLARLRQMTTTELRAEYGRVTGEKPRSNNRSYLFKRLILKAQEPDAAALDGGKFETINLPKSEAAPAGVIRDPRLPAAGTILTRVYKSKTLQVLCREKDFEYAGESFRSLSAIARRVTGVAWNGFLFFNLIPTGKAV